MATKPGFGKRVREREKADERSAKAAKRAERREKRKNRPADYDPYTIVMPEKLDDG
jgi:hypothetical protein